MQRLSAQKNNVQKSTLYSVVFDAVAVRYIVAFMFVFFVMHPAVPAFASEDVSSDTMEESAPASEPEPEPEVVPVQVTDTVDEPVSEEVSVEELVSEESVLENDDETEVVSGEAVPENTEGVTEDVVPTNDEASTETEEVILDEVEVIDGSTDGAQEPVDTSDTSSDSEGVPLDEEDVSDPAVTDESTQEDEALVSSGGSSSGESDATGEENDEPSVSDPQQEEEAAETDLEALSMLLASSTLENEDPSGYIAGASTSTETEVVPDDSAEGESEVVPEVADTDNDVSQNEDSGEEELLEVAPVEAVASTSATTEVVAEELPQESFVTNKLNAHQFADTECVSVGDGSFYCSQNESAPEYVEDRVFAASDADGDMEIFVTIAGKTTQITHNLVDDSSPAYDGLSNTIVWHSMQHDRFQIAQYSVKTGEVTYLTDTSYNNMEPVAYGDIVMWQAWVGNDWEIMISDNGQVSQLTDNDVHDITPQMRDGYIMWQTQFAEGWKVALYDEKAGKVKYIADSDGSKVANPRFVLVYDSTDKVGDVRTLGYDFGSGSSFTLGSLPAEMPEEIPDPDQTGETRALIQTKSAGREGEVEEITIVPVGTSTSTQDSFTEGDLVIESINQATTTDELPEEAQVEQVAEITDKPVTTSGGSVSHIDEIVIPPFVATTTDEVG